MVKHVALVLVALTAIARAHPPPCDDCDQPPPVIEESVEEDDEPGFNMVGFHFNVGALPLPTSKMTTLSLGLALEHPVFKKTRVFAEYEWMWLIHRPDDREIMSTSTLPRPDEHASGHRAQLGLRRELAAKRGSGKLRLFIDGELGGGLALVNDNIKGVQTIPSAFIGLHMGYDIYTQNDDSPSRTFEAELLFRAVAVQHGIGGLFGIGFAWGN